MTSFLPPADIIGVPIDPPLEIEGYLFVMRLAYGGSGEIFAAINRRNELVALKILHPHLASDNKCARAFQEEISLLKRMNDPIFPTPISSGKMEGRPYFEMELIRGCDLAEIIREFKRREKTPGEEVALAIAFPVAMAVERLHSRHKFVHRDLSPQNIIVDFAGRVRIADLGIAKDSESASLTRTGEVKGKAAYISPEQAAGKKVTAATDLFSLGAIMFELITGEPLYPIERGDIWGQALNCEHDAPKRLSGRASPELEKLISAMVAREASNRPPAEELVAILDATAKRMGVKLDAETVKRGVWSVADALYAAFENKLGAYKSGYPSLTPSEARRIERKKAALSAAIIFFSFLTMLITLLYKSLYF
ncbi:MAG: hypothetical protein Kow0090_09780 [Myxococcota bacterium]